MANKKPQTENVHLSEPGSSQENPINWSSNIPLINSMAHYAYLPTNTSHKQEKNNSWKYQTNSAGRKSAFLEIIVWNEKFCKFQIFDSFTGKLWF